MFYTGNQVQIIPRRYKKLPRITDYDKRHVNPMIFSCKKTRDGVTTYDACTVCISLLN